MLEGRNLLVKEYRATLGPLFTVSVTPRVHIWSMRSIGSKGPKVSNGLTLVSYMVSYMVSFLGIGIFTPHINTSIYQKIPIPKTTIYILVEDTMSDIPR